ncbi:hypothetical protein BC829DRAFT_446586 [Chytridium lagenaria]|nr:hypothetical protein BC829DRAFT_446586 [Chytridium lagenaria]
MSCRYIEASLPPSTAFTSVRACLVYCGTVSSTRYQAGISPISATNTNPGCFCFSRTDDPFITTGGEGCLPCRSDPNYNCGSYVGNIVENPAQQRPPVDSKSVYLHDAIFEAPPPSPSSSPPPPQPQPPSPSPSQSPDSPIQQPPITTQPNDANPSPENPSSATQRITLTTFVTGTDGIITARPQTLATVNAVIGRPTTSGVMAETTASVLPTSAMDGASGSSSSSNTAVIVGGVCAALVVVVGAAALFFFRRSTRRKMDIDATLIKNSAVAATPRGDAPPSDDTTNQTAAPSGAEHSDTNVTTASHAMASSPAIASSPADSAPLVTPIAVTYIPNNDQKPKHGLFSTSPPMNSTKRGSLKHDIYLTEGLSTSLFPNEKHAKEAEVGGLSWSKKEALMAPPRVHSQRGAMRGDTVMTGTGSMVEEAPPMYSVNVRE